MSQCIICSQIFSIYGEPNAKFCSSRCERESCKTWRYWKDTITNQKYEINFDTSEGMSLANDISKNLVRISEFEFKS